MGHASLVTHGGRQVDGLLGVVLALAKFGETWFSLSKTFANAPWGRT